MVEVSDFIVGMFAGAMLVLIVVGGIQACTTNSEMQGAGKLFCEHGGGVVFSEQPDSVSGSFGLCLVSDDVVTKYRCVGSRCVWVAGG